MAAPTAAAPGHQTPSTTPKQLQRNTQAPHHMPTPPLYPTKHGPAVHLAGGQTCRPAGRTWRHQLLQLQSIKHHPPHLNNCRGTPRHLIMCPHHPSTQAWTRSPPSRWPNVPTSGTHIAAPTAAAPGHQTPSTTPKQLQRNTQAPHHMPTPPLYPSMDPQST
jgi:hypothetical protein